MSPNSDGWGSFTLTTISTRVQTSAGVGTISAPARRYSSSGRELPSPAPASTTTR